MNDVDAFKFFFEYFDLKNFLASNPPVRLLILGATVLLLLIVVYLACRLIKKKVLRYTAKKAAASASTQNAPIDQTKFLTVMNDSRTLAWLLILGWGFRHIVIGPLYEFVINLVFTTLCTLAGIRLVAHWVPFQMDIYLRRRGSQLENSQARSLLPIIEGVIWAIGGTFLLDNLGLKVSTIIAGLGIVGVAVGMAGQTVLKDFFGYLVILLDKPFRLGDFVELGNGKSGNVVDVGPKTTRLMSLEGNLIVCANSEVTTGVLVNQGSIREREVEIVLGIAYSNPMPVVRKFPELIRDVVNSFPQCRFERCCMTQFGTANYLFQLIYKVKEQPGGLTDFMNTQMDVNLAIQEKENEERIAGAYPTQTILLTDMTPAKETQEP